MSLGTLVAETWIKQRLATALPNVEVEVYPAPNLTVGVTLRFIAHGPVRRGSASSREIFEELIYEVAATADLERQYRLAAVVTQIKGLDRKSGYAIGENGQSIGKVIECLHEGPITLPYKTETGITRQRTGYQFRIRTQAAEVEADFIGDEGMLSP